MLSRPCAESADAAVHGRVAQPPGVLPWRASSTRDTSECAGLPVRLYGKRHEKRLSCHPLPPPGCGVGLPLLRGSRYFCPQKGMSRRELACRAGVSKNTICKWAQGEAAKVDLSTLNLVCTRSRCSLVSC